MNSEKKKVETKDILSDLKRQHKLTNEKIADYVGVSETAVSNWMHGQTPKFENMEKLAELFHVSVSYLYGESPDIDDKDLIDLIKQFDVLRKEAEEKKETISKIQHENQRQQTRMDQLIINQRLTTSTVIMFFGYILLLVSGKISGTDPKGSLASFLVFTMGIILVSYGTAIILINKNLVFNRAINNALHKMQQNSEKGRSDT